MRRDDWVARHSHLGVRRCRSALVDVRYRGRQSRVASHIGRCRCLVTSDDPFREESHRATSFVLTLVQIRTWFLLTKYRFAFDERSRAAVLRSDVLSRVDGIRAEVSVNEVVRFFHGPGKALNFALASHSLRVSGRSLFSLALSAAGFANERAALFGVSEKQDERDRRGGTGRNGSGGETPRTKVFGTVQADKAAAPWNILTYITTKLGRGYGAR